MASGFGILTIEDYLSDCVNFPVTERGIRVILSERGITPGTFLHDLTVRERRLCKADLYFWICTSPRRMGAVSDRDNGWEHSDGGFTLSDTERNFYLGEANAIYSEYGEPLRGMKRIKVHNYGIKPVNSCWNPGYAVCDGSAD